jgi:hypothetical protein
MALLSPIHGHNQEHEWAKSDVTVQPKAACIRHRVEIAHTANHQLSFLSCDSEVAHHEGYHYPLLQSLLT